MRSACSWLITIVACAALGFCAAQRSHASAEVGPTSHPLVQEYAALLARLPLDQPASVTSATLAWHHTFDAQPVHLRDAAFHLFHRWHPKVLEQVFNDLNTQAYTHPLKPSDIQGISDYEGHAAALLRLMAAPEMRAAGLGFGYFEADYCAQPAALFYVGEFGALLSTPLREFLKLESEELRQQPTNEFCRTITIGEWGERLSNWQRYVVQFSAAPECPEAQRYAAWYLRGFVHEFEDPAMWVREGPVLKELDAEYKEAYTQYVLVNGDLPAAEPIRAFYQLLSEHGFRHPGNEILEDFYKKHQPPDLYSSPGEQP